MQICEESDGFKSMENANLFAKLLLSLVVTLNSQLVFCGFHQDQVTVHISINWSKQIYRTLLIDTKHCFEVAFGCRCGEANWLEFTLHLLIIFKALV